MHHTRWRYLYVFYLLALGACEPAPKTYHTQFLAMGTRIDLRVQAATPAEAAQLSADVEQNMLHWGREWYPWGTANGELKQLNIALSQGKALPVSNELRDLLSLARELQQRSDGYFDPAIAPMIEAWGFNDMDRAATPPSGAQLVAWRAHHATLKDLIIDGTVISSTRRDLQIDLGAIAKGYAVDLCMQRLRAKGVREAGLNIGGELRVLGGPSEPIGIRDPRHDGAVATLRLNGDESIATSGDYERFAIINGRRVHHLLDPHSGEPVTHTRAVTVVAHDAALADAAATALMAAGPDHWQRIAQQLGVREALRIASNGDIEVTAELHARLQWNEAARHAYRITRVVLHD